MLACKLIAFITLFILLDADNFIRCNEIHERVTLVGDILVKKDSQVEC